ncbi:MAG: DUF5615 family PIN-like protein [Chloroflexi bacterium]|nr:DUF5615 family PIN-like protein [Chloroflexota bacterium]
MQFRIDADLPRSSANVIRRYGYEATDVRDIGLRHAKDEEIARYAKQNQLCRASKIARIENASRYYFCSHLHFLHDQRYSNSIN